MAFVQHAWLGYIQTENIVTITNITSRVNKANTANVIDWYFVVFTNYSSIESPKYASETLAITARNTLKSDLGI